MGISKKDKKNFMSAVTVVFGWIMNLVRSLIAYFQKKKKTSENTVEDVNGAAKNTEDKAPPVSNIRNSVPTKYFGTDGFRGKLNQTLTPFHAYLIGRYLGYEISGGGKRGKCVIGRDTRVGGEMLLCAAAAGLAASGADVYRLGVIPTPGLSYITKSSGFDVGIMISASHNPYDDNGIKLFCGSGEKASDELILKIEEYLDSVICGKDDTLPYSTADEVGNIINYPDGVENYIKMLKSQGKKTLEGMKIALDLANGATAEIGASVFEEMGAEVYIIGCEPNGKNINRGVGSTAPERLCELVTRVGADVGFAFDGDGDRCIAVDSDGSIMNGDHILYVLAQWLMEESRLSENRIATTVASNSALAVALAGLGVSVEYTDVGDRFVSERMKEKNLALGGEP